MSPPNRNVVLNLPNVFQEFRTRTDRYAGSFFPNAISLWNNFISSFQNFPTFLELKNHLISLFRPKANSIFGIHDSISLRHLFQLRVGLSKLRHHKKRHNFLDTPSDTCLCKNGVEDTDHYLIYCPFYNTYRADLKSKVSAVISRNELNFNISSNLLLYGHDSLSFQDNRDVLLATLEFIFKSKRFAD